MMAHFTLLILSGFLACFSLVFDDDRIGRTLLAISISIITVWLVWYY